MDIDINEIVNIAIAAGSEILKIYNDGGKDIQSWQKADKSPLTAADLAAHNLILERLLKAYPNIPVISEESASLPYEQRKNYEYCWMVDPLDGTKEFINRNGDFTVNIALIEKKKPVAGVIYVPVTDTSYYAVAGKGAFSLRGNSRAKLKAPVFYMDDKGLKIVGSRSHMNEETTKYLSQFKHAELVAKGSSLKFMMIAEGQAHLYPRIAPTMEWDTAAAQAILEEAGGRVIDFEFSKPLEYNKENLLNPHFVAMGNHIRND